MKKIERHKDQVKLDRPRRKCELIEELRDGLMRGGGFYGAAPSIMDGGNRKKKRLKSEY